MTFPTVAEIAAHIDLSRPVTSQMMKQLGLEARKTTLDQARVAYIRHLRVEKMRGRPKTKIKGKELHYGDEKARLTKMQADKAELELDILKKRVLDVESVVSQWEKRFAALRGHLLTLPTKVSTVAMQAQTMSDVHDAVKLEIRQALDEASEAQRGFTAD